MFTILFYSLYIVYSTNNPQVLYISDITGWIYIGCLSLCLPARLLSVDSVSLIGQMAAEPQVDAAQVNGAEMKVSHLSQFVFTNSVHPVCYLAFAEQLRVMVVK